MELRLDLFAHDPVKGTVPIIDAGLDTISHAAIDFAPGRVRVDVPGDFLADTTTVHVAAIIGTAEEGTNCSPNGGFLASGPLPPLEVPALDSPGKMLLAVMILFSAFLLKARRSSQGERSVR